LFSKRKSSKCNFEDLCLLAQQEIDDAMARDRMSEARVIGLLPMALKPGEGSQAYAPLMTSLATITR